jgi:hypothetical protein
VAERILVIGNCQAPGIAQLLEHMIPGANVANLTLNAPSEAKKELAQRLSEFDLVFAQPHREEVAGPLAFRELQSHHARVVLYPRIIFGGFHPDFIDCSGIKGAESAASNYHSLIVAAAYVNGVPVKEVEKLFNRFTFARLGYFKEYENGKRFVLSKAQELGYDLADDFVGWEATGIFMHTPNHPSLQVLASVATKAAAMAGLRLETESAEGVQDRLEGWVRLPVYRGIAKRLNVDPQPEFTLQMRSGVRTFHLPKYITQTYALYGSASDEFFQNPRIQRVAAALREQP